MHAINEIAKRHDLWVIEDAACGFGAKYHDRHVGSLGTAGCFSFHPRKAITTGEGGMVTTDDKALAEKKYAVLETTQCYDVGPSAAYGSKAIFTSRPS